MPTGYTAAIQDGISFKDFTLRCARAFGALMELRDSPTDAPIPKKLARSSYYANALREAKAELARLEAMSPADADEVAARKHREAEEHRLAALDKDRLTRERYEAMLAQVRAWTPPTTDHVGLKEFMESQIVESIRFDSMGDYYAKPTVKLSGAAWLAQEKAAAHKSVARYEEEAEKENALVDDRQGWLDALRESLR